MTSTLPLSPSWSLLYCSVHQRAWIEEGNYWVTCVASPQDTRAVTEVACDTCMADAFATFRTQFPGLYASGAGHSTALAARHE